jgi:glutathione synthase/RimK-type ligase-like ATP-grasp enzyme
VNKNRIVVLTGNNNFFGQTRKPWVSMNFKKIHNILCENGFTVEKYTFNEIAGLDDRINNSLIFYTFSQKLNRRIYINDIIRYIDNGSNFLIPSYDLLKCHENKGYQELYKKKIGLNTISAHYFSSIDELRHHDIKFPIVLKTIDGSNGKGVFLAKNKNELIEIVNNLERQNTFTLLDLFRRKYFRRKKSYKEYSDYSNKKDYEQYKDYILKEKNFILQEFIPDLKFDYRVLVLYDKYYVTKRHIKKNDFRASGAKRFDFNFKADTDLLNYARDIYNKFDTPFLSMDICIHQDNFYLFEFQALHFGINVFVKSNGYYILDNDNWQFIEKSLNLETEIANGLIKYIKAF